MSVQFIPGSHMAGFLCKLKKVGLLFSVGMKGAKKGKEGKKKRRLNDSLH